MDSAIVTGGYGRLGSELVNLLVSQGVKTLCIGRLKSQNLKDFEIDESDGILTKLRLSQSCLKNISKKAQEIPWKSSENCVLFNMAWGESGKLAIPIVSQQINSCTLVSDFITLAKAYGCIRMIQAGSQQERFVENFLEEEWKTMNYQTSQGIYGVAKILARNIASKLCYLNQIEFINVRFCSYVPDDIGGSGFVDSTLKSILTGGKNPNPQSTQWTEIVPIKEIARAFVLAGFYGVNNADYYVGTSTPHKLKDYFNYFILAVKGHQNPESAWNIYSIDERDQRHFDPQLLYSHVGFELEDDFASFTQRILAK